MILSTVISQLWLGWSIELAHGTPPAASLVLTQQQLGPCLGDFL